MSLTGTAYIKKLNEEVAPTNPFDAAIEVLGYAQEGLGYWKSNPYPDLGTTWTWNSPEAKSKYDSLVSAIRVLEVAGKVDKELAIKTMRRLYPVLGAVFDTIMPLFEALPDAEKKDKDSG